MLTSSLSIDPALARVARSLALLSRRVPQLELVRRHGKTAELAFDRFAAGFERNAPDVRARARTAYLDALVLAKTLSGFVTDDHVTRDRCSRFLRSTGRILDALDRFVAAPDRALRLSLFGNEPTCSEPRGRVVQ